ncbi:phage integrase SAM-like domain-containing protein, partial [Ethanoligenens sp.]|uniref:phage integrase SAM-like domain-containing protein n=1 Tax=Ethanoligenens sp. TaxID=2099655 RepID=UPI0039E8357D
MSVASRQVKNKRDGNGKLTGRSGVVYDVNIKYKVLGGYKAHVKRGFTKKSDAVDYEAAMKVKLSAQSVSTLSTLSKEGNQTLQSYITKWVDRHGAANLRPSSLACYKSHIKNHIIPVLGSIRLKDLVPDQLDDFYRMLSEQDLASSTIKTDHRILSAALEAAHKYQYIERNPAHDIVTRFVDDSHLPDPYTVEQ